MSIKRDMDQCSDCKAWLPAEDPRPKGASRTPCPQCGSTKQIKYPSAHIQASVSVGADAKLIIRWQEIDRLLAEKEYAAALLVAAVNVEFILWENLRRFSRKASPSIQDKRVRSMWGQVASGHPEKLTLSSLRSIAEHMSQHGFALAGPWTSRIGSIEDVRNRIAHKRGYFSELTQLKYPKWPEIRFRQVLDDAKTFCLDNAP